jgi:hypothetical protein
MKHMGFICLFVHAKLYCDREIWILNQSKSPANARRRGLDTKGTLVRRETWKATNTTELVSVSRGNRPPPVAEPALPIEGTAMLGETEAILELTGTGFNDLTE